MNQILSNPESAQSLFLIIAVWDGIWKALALWYAAQEKKIGWFAALFVFNTLGILPIIYLAVINKEKPFKVWWAKLAKRGK